MWKYENVEVSKCRSVEVWNCGSLEAWSVRRFDTSTIPHFHTATLSHFHTPTLHTSRLPHFHASTFTYFRFAPFHFHRHGMRKYHAFVDSRAVIDRSISATGHTRTGALPLPPDHRQVCFGDRTPTCALPLPQTWPTWHVETITPLSMAARSSTCCFGDRPHSHLRPSTSADMACVTLLSKCGSGPAFLFFLGMARPFCCVFSLGMARPFCCVEP